MALSPVFCRLNILSPVTILPRFFVNFVNNAVNGSLVAGYLKLYLPLLFAGFKEILLNHFLRGQAGS